MPASTRILNGSNSRQWARLLSDEGKDGPGAASLEEVWWPEKSGPKSGTTFEHSFLALSTNFSSL